MGFFSWLCFSGADWLSRQTAITWYISKYLQGLRYESPGSGRGVHSEQLALVNVSQETLSQLVSGAVFWSTGQYNAALHNMVHLRNTREVSCSLFILISSISNRKNVHKSLGRDCVTRKRLRDWNTINTCESLLSSQSPGLWDRHIRADLFLAVLIPAPKCYVARQSWWTSAHVSDVT